MKGSGPKIVFCGPTLAPPDMAGDRDLLVLPPAAQGDLLGAVKRHEPSAVLLIDGLFQTEPAIRHKEILWTLSQGIPVLGAASMGALRAAELHPHMQGVGLIYRWYRRVALAPDDAVAVLHGPAEVNSPPLTEALVDMRRTLKRAGRAGALPPALCGRLAAVAGATGFRDRTWLRIVSRACPEEPQAHWKAALAALQRHAVRQKRIDALQALAVLRSGDLQLPTALPPFATTRAFALELELA